MTDRDKTKRMFTRMINMIEQHDTMTISCGDPLMKLLKDVRELLNKQPEIVMCKDCKKRYKKSCGYFYADGRIMCDDWFCADGVAKDINVLGKEGR